MLGDKPIQNCIRNDVLLGSFFLDHRVGAAGGADGVAVESPQIIVSKVSADHWPTHGVLLLRDGQVVQRGGEPVARSVWNMVLRDGHFWIRREIVGLEYWMLRVAKLSLRTSISMSYL